MCIYIIGNDGITLCRWAPATVNDGKIAVASKDELHAAPVSGQRLLALWNALPGAEKRRKVGDCEAMIDRLTSYRASHDIFERLAAADPGNAGWQRDLSVSHNKGGDVQRAQGDLSAALTSYRAAHDIFERLATADPGNAGWQRDLSVSHNRSRGGLGFADLQTRCSSRVKHSRFRFGRLASGS